MTDELGFWCLVVFGGFIILCKTLKILVIHEIVCIMKLLNCVLVVKRGLSLVVRGQLNISQYLEAMIQRPN